MSDFLASLTQVQQWISSLAARYTVFFPTPHGEANYRFTAIGADDDVRFAPYRPTITPPVKLLVPAREELFRFQHKEDGDLLLSPSVDSSFRVIAGVRPCDLKGIFLMDLFFERGVADPYYLARRENTAIIGYACTTPCTDRVFCAAVDSLDHRQGADLFLTPLASGEILVEANTERGIGLLDSTDLPPCEDGPARKIGAIAARPETYGRSFDADVQSLSGIVEQYWDSPLWDKHTERCFSCGTCNLVCPTCYCFDVRDNLALDTVSGSRTRTWDGCMLPGFAQVAGGHNFRPQPAGRQRHRVKRKFEYLPTKYGHGPVCVGCGRCGRQCTVDIDIYDIVHDLIEGGKS